MAAPEMRFDSAKPTKRLPTSLDWWGAIAQEAPVVRADMRGGAPMVHPMMSWFDAEYTGKRSTVARGFARLATALDAAAPDGPEKDRAMQRLVSAKDLAVRAIPVLEQSD